MKIIKNFETVLNLTANETFRDIDKLILEKLQLFKGKCEGNSLIIEIKDIIRRSHPRVAKFALDGSTFVNVQYSALVIQFKPGEILSNCRIIRMDRYNFILCEHKYAICHVKGIKDLVALRDQQSISIIVEHTTYTKGKNKISVIGKFFTYPEDFVIYRITEDINEIDKKIIDQYLQEIEKLEKKIEKDDPKIIDHLRKTYYPFHNEQEGKYEDIKKIPSIGTLIGRPPWLEKSKPKVVIFSEPVEMEQKETAGKAMFEMLRDYYYFIYNLHKTAAILDTETLDKYSNLWNIYKHIKK
ncbi:MAG: hypothetical protein QW303_00510 [Nitrososphaerota archaeon]